MRPEARIICHAPGLPRGPFGILFVVACGRIDFPATALGGRAVHQTQAQRGVPQNGQVHDEGKSEQGSTECGESGQSPQSDCTFRRRPAKPRAGSGRYPLNGALARLCMARTPVLPAPRQRVDAAVEGSSRQEIVVIVGRSTETRPFAGRMATDYDARLQGNRCFGLQVMREGRQGAEAVVYTQDIVHARGLGVMTVMERRLLRSREGVRRPSRRDTSVGCGPRGFLPLYRIRSRATSAMRRFWDRYARSNRALQSMGRGGDGPVFFFDSCSLFIPFLVITQVRLARGGIRIMRDSQQLHRMPPWSARLHKSEPQRAVGTRF